MQEKRVTEEDLDNIESLHEEIHALREQYLAVQQGLMKQNLRLIELEDANETKDYLANLRDALSVSQVDIANLMTRMTALESQADSLSEHLDDAKHVDHDGLMCKIAEQVWSIVQCAYCQRYVDRKSSAIVPETIDGTVTDHIICSACLVRVVADLQELEKTKASKVLEALRKRKSRKRGGAR